MQNNDQYMQIFGQTVFLTCFYLFFIKKYLKDIKVRANFDYYPITGKTQHISKKLF